MSSYPISSPSVFDGRRVQIVIIVIFFFFLLTTTTTTIFLLVTLSLSVLCTPSSLVASVPSMSF